MKNVKIISGTYGYNKEKHIIPKNRQSGVFALEDKEAERLVDLEVAVYADVPKKSAGFVPSDEKTDIPSENEEDSGENGEEFAEADLSYTENSNVSELRNVGKAVGITFPVGTTKKDMLAALDSYFGQSEAEAPVLDIAAEEPVE